MENNEFKPNPEAAKNLNDFLEGLNATSRSGYELNEEVHFSYQEKWSLLYQKLNEMINHDPKYQDDIPQAVLNNVVDFMNELEKE